MNYVAAYLRRLSSFFARSAVVVIPARARAPEFRGLNSRGDVSSMRPRNVREPQAPVSRREIISKRRQTRDPRIY